MLLLSGSVSAAPELAPSPPREKGATAAPAGRSELAQPAAHPLPSGFEDRTRLSRFLAFEGSWGGEDLVTVEFEDSTADHLGGQLARGRVGTRVVPWVRGLHALSFSLEAGVRAHGVSAINGSVTFRRFPLLAVAQYNRRMLPYIDLFVAAGPQYETGVWPSGDGDFDGLGASRKNALGFRLEAGSYFDAGSIGLELALEYTRIRYEHQGLPGSINGSNLGLLVAVHWGILKEGFDR